MVSLSVCCCTNPTLIVPFVWNMRYVTAIAWAVAAQDGFCAGYQTHGWKDDNTTV